MISAFHIYVFVAFGALIVLEAVLSAKRQLELYQRSDTFANLSVAFGSMVVNVASETQVATCSCTVVVWQNRFRMWLNEKLLPQASC